MSVRQYREPTWLSDEVPTVDWPECSNSGAKIDHIVATPLEADFHNLRESVMRTHRYIAPGVYRRLYILDGDGWHLQMSDTPAERLDHSDFVSVASGDVLVTGLGLGVVVNALLRRSQIKRVTVQEINPHVIHLVQPLLVGVHGGERLVIIQQDALAYKPGQGERYDWIWHDIWPEMRWENQPTYTALRRKWNRRVPVGQQMAWCQQETFRK